MMHLSASIIKLDFKKSGLSPYELRYKQNKNNNFCARVRSTVKTRHIQRKKFGQETTQIDQWLTSLSKHQRPWDRYTDYINLCIIPMRIFCAVNPNFIFGAPKSLKSNFVIDVLKYSFLLLFLHCVLCNLSNPLQPKIAIVSFNIFH